MTATTPETVVRRHIAAFERGDVDAIVADYADDAVVQTQHGTVRGREALRGLFEMYLELLPPGTPLTTDTFSVAGDVVFTTWHAATDGFSIPLAVDTVIVREGRIVAQTAAVHVLPPGQ